MNEHAEHDQHAHEQEAPELAQAPVLDPKAPTVTLTPKAVEMVRKTREKDGLSEDHGLRISVVGGGCSGFSYSLTFDSEKEGDKVVRFDDVRVFVDEVSLPYLSGVTLDF